MKNNTKKFILLTLVLGIALSSIIAQDKETADSATALVSDVKEGSSEKETVLDSDKSEKWTSTEVGVMVCIVGCFCWTLLSPIRFFLKKNRNKEFNAEILKIAEELKQGSEAVNDLKNKMIPLISKELKMPYTLDSEWAYLNKKIKAVSNSAAAQQELRDNNKQLIDQYEALVKIRAENKKVQDQIAQQLKQYEEKETQLVQAIDKRHGKELAEIMKKLIKI